MMEDIDKSTGYVSFCSDCFLVVTVVDTHALTEFGRKFYIFVGRNL